MMKYLLLLSLVLPVLASGEDIKSGNIFEHISGGTPSISLNTPGAGTGASVSFTGNDSFIVITLVGGTSGTNNTDVMTITTSYTFPSTIVPVCSPVTSTAMGNSIGTATFIGLSSSTWKIKSGASAIANGTTYTWACHIGA